MSNRWAEDSQYRYFLHNQILPSYNPNAARLEFIAQRTGIKPYTLRKMLEGKISVIPDDLPRLYNASGDVALIAWIVNKCHKLSLVKRTVYELSGDFDDDLEGLLAAISTMFSERRMALTDGILDDDKKDHLLRFVRDIQRITDTIEAEIKNM